MEAIELYGRDWNACVPCLPPTPLHLSTLSVEQALILQAATTLGGRRS